MEVECIRFFAEIFGMNPKKVDGVLNPGGTMSNMMAFLTARHR
jgi:glutamate/tyrosine decarboxylase-like PLP-dependent enzyme